MDFIMKPFKAVKDYISDTVKAVKLNLLDFYDIIKNGPYELCITIIFLLCIILLHALLLVIIGYPFYYSFHKIVEELNNRQTFSPFQDF